jgi:hypothetical protein
MMLSATVMAAQNSQTFYLVTAARAGKVQLPRGICEVTWSPLSGSRVRLNIKAEDQKTVKVLARDVEGSQGTTGMVLPSWMESRTCRSFTPATPHSFFKTGQMRPNDSIGEALVNRTWRQMHNRKIVRLRLFAIVTLAASAAAPVTLSKCKPPVDEYQPLSRRARRSCGEADDARREAVSAPRQWDGAQSAVDDASHRVDQWWFFNLFNIVNMGLPVNILTGSGFGEISKTAGTSRQTQFSLKLIY